MSDRIRVEDEAAVEVSPAPPHPRSESAALSPREPTGGSPCRDWIDELVEESIKRGPRRIFDKCPHCHLQWHGMPDYGSGCAGSHLPVAQTIPITRSETIQWDQLGGMPQ